MHTKKQIGQKLLFAAGCLVCAGVCWKSALAFDGTEFGSGALAGNQEFSTLLFVGALVIVFKLPRWASTVALVASYFSLPLYLYLVFPRPFRQVWPGEWSVLELPRESFVWNGWWVTGILATILVSIWCVVQRVRSFSPAVRTVKG